MTWPEAAAWGLAALPSVPLLTLAAECVAVLLPQQGASSPPAESRPRLAVLVPAHNESVGLIPTLRDVTAQLRPGDRLLVVADNCTDDTAGVARAHGAEVAERLDPERRGKGYALAFGRDALAGTPPEVVVVVDADCRLGPEALTWLACAGRGRPAQGAYRMTAPVGAGSSRQVAAFAFLVKNVVRPLGLGRLGGPCLLTGTGMAFPWGVFAAAPLAHGHIVEDMGLAVHLAASGVTAAFVPEAEVWGEFPADDAAASTQRRRWEHGHLSVIRAGVPRLVVATIRRGRLGPLALALDLAVPPLSALAMGSVVALAVLTAWGALAGHWGPAVLLAGAAGLGVLGVLGAWARFGRATLPAGAIVQVPLYALGKVRLYAAFVWKPQRVWVRTARSERATADVPEGTES